jgi:hypothetical protein
LREVRTGSRSPILARHLCAGQTVKTDTLPAMNVDAKQHEHRSQVTTTPEEANIWLTMVFFSVLSRNILMHLLLV